MAHPWMQREPAAGGKLPVPEHQTLASVFAAYVDTAGQPLPEESFQDAEVLVAEGRAGGAAGLPAR